jgi:predicted patatin/cPLA2 family phospholipase
MLDKFKFTTLIRNIVPEHIPKKLNLILEGGCMNGAYEIGGLTLLKELEKKELTSIEKISGASVGAYAGFLFLTDSLNKYIDEYGEMRDSFKKHLKLIKLEEQLRFLVNKLSDIQFKSLQKDKLFITFYNVDTQQQEVISKYSTREELITSILKSCHLPFLINGECFYVDKKTNTKYIDGGVPYLFPIQKSETDIFPIKNLYMKLTQYDRIKTTINVSYEKTVHGRILEGLIDTYNFFLKKSETNMCSYVEDWSQINKFYYKFCELGYKLIIILIYTFSILINTVSPKFKKTHFYKHFSPIFYKIYKKVLIYLVFV